MPVSRARRVAQSPAPPIVPRPLKHARPWRRWWSIGGHGMRVIARIPDVSDREEAVAAADSAAGPRRPALRQRGSDGILAGIEARWPTWPVAALAVIAVMTWMLASWNDHVRLERQRATTRLARQPQAAPTCEPTAPPGAGAVIR